MTRKFCAFDIETFPGDDGKTEISCIGAAWKLEPSTTAMWYGHPVISKDAIRDFVHFLSDRIAHGSEIVTWNGLGYDFKILHENAPDDIKKRVSDLAISNHHIDPMFQFLCMKGFPVGIKAVAEGMQLGSKTEGMDGLTASDLWINGTDADRVKILEYVVQDAKLALSVAQAIEDGNILHWITKKGYVKSVQMERLLPVTECLKISLPDTSWMDSPMTRGDCFSWVMG